MGVRVPGAVLSAAALLLAGCGDVPVEVGRPPGLPTALSAPDVGPATQDGSCPTEFPAVAGPWVPELPTTETPGRLVPDADPVGALVCRYADRSSREGQAVPLRAQAEVTQGLERVRADLHLPEALPGRSRSCTQVGGPVVPHLVRLDYADGSLWVSAVEDPNSCTESGNGAFITTAYLGDRLATAFDDRRWPPAPDAAGCSSPAGGRAGQEDRLVPDGWSTAEVCPRPVNGLLPRPEPVPADRARRAVEVLDGAELAPGSGGCSGGDNTAFDVLFRYPEGNPVTVSLNVGCEPPLRNGSVDGRLDIAQQRELQDLLTGPGARPR